MKLFLLSFFILFFLTSLYSQDSAQFLRQHPFSGALFFGGDAGISLSETDYREIRPNVVDRGYLEYFFPTTNVGIFGLRAFAMGGYVDGQDEFKQPQIFNTRLARVGGGISYNISISGVVFPYLFAGVDYGNSTPRDEFGNNLLFSGESRDYENYLIEFGVRITIVSSLALNLSVTGHKVPNDYLDNIATGIYQDFFYTIQGGLSVSLLGYDTDGDGVSNSEDICPETPSGVGVNEFGCPVDADSDNVPDYLDKCPNTGKGISVNDEGCPIDSDGDKVPDSNDRCPNTPDGIVVNEFGCPDSDSDGVSDNIDKCPGTPFGIPVNEDGCPRDSDGDGIPNYLDKCPNTPPGRPVDSTGCELTADTVVTNIILGGDTNFEVNKSILLSSAYIILDNFAATMIKNPSMNWRIEGHTDSRGSDQANMKLSRARAQAVADYLISTGVNPLNLKIVPLGETQPIADNKTAEGRAMNRRVEIKAVENNSNNPNSR